MRKVAVYEEAICIGKYGNAYVVYRNKTPKWIGIPKSDKKDLQFFDCLLRALIPNAMESKRSFIQMLKAQGYSDEAAKELWKRYDSTEKKASAR